MKTEYDLSSEIPWPSLVSYYEEFLDTRIVELDLIKTALKTKNYKVLVDFAHKWRGFSAPYGFGVLGQIALLLEECLEASNYDGCQSLIDEVEVYLSTKTFKQKKGDS